MDDVSRTIEAARARLDEQVDEIVTLAEIPAPPFAEERRASRVLERFREIGLHRPRRDEVGNVLADLVGRDPDGPTVLVAAHVDTVFPAETDVTVTRADGVLRGPGIGDNAANLGAMLSVARLLVDGGGLLRGRLVLVGTVGEEGLGDLRGMKRLMADLADETDAVVCLDGFLGTVVVRGVASRRYRIRCRGPGGHSFADFGRPSAVHALARLVSRVVEIPVPGTPKTTFNVGTFTGGEGITNIASRAELLLDLRSEDPAELERLTAEVARLVGDEDREDDLTIEVEEIGYRPGGATPVDSPVVTTVVEALEAVGVEAELEGSSTDANVPMGLGIPAVTFGTYRGRGTHTLEEEVDIDGLDLGLAAAALVLRRLTAP